MIKNKIGIAHLTKCLEEELDLKDAVEKLVMMFELMDYNFHTVSSIQVPEFGNNHSYTILFENRNGLQGHIEFAFTGDKIRLVGMRLADNDSYKVFLKKIYMFIGEDNWLIDREDNYVIAYNDTQKQKTIITLINKLHDLL